MARLRMKVAREDVFSFCLACWGGCRLAVRYPGGGKKRGEQIIGVEHFHGSRRKSLRAGKLLTGARDRYTGVAYHWRRGANCNHLVTEGTSQFISSCSSIRAVLVPFFTPDNLHLSRPSPFAPLHRACLPPLLVLLTTYCSRTGLNLWETTGQGKHQE